MLALIGTMGLIGMPAAYSAQSKDAQVEPTSIAAILKAKREEQAKKQPSVSKKETVSKKSDTVKKTNTVRKSESKKTAAAKPARTTSKIRAKAPAKARSVKKDVVAANVDRQVTGSITRSSVQYTSLINHYAATYGVPVSLAHAVVKIESNFRPNTTGRAGEIGLMQIKLSTARGLGYTGTAKALYEPDTNIRYGMKYLAGAHKLGNGSTCGTILKYNAGHGAKRMNPTSANYCAKVKAHMTGV